VKYTVWLRGGGQVELDFPEQIRVIDVMSAPRNAGWLADRGGAMINLEHVAALVPDVQYPATLVDGEGDEFRHVGDGQYVLVGGAGTHYSFSEIKEQYGIQSMDGSTEGCEGVGG
jgi:hypothetical protein